MAEDIIVCENLVKIYKTKDLEVLALQGLDLNIAKGELMAIIGNSGSGKSTFARILAGVLSAERLFAAINSGTVVLYFLATSQSVSSFAG